jgi:UDPglucose 6-dehydrogenase
MKVCTIGTGYVGLVTGVCLAHIGHEVICVDNNPTKVALMQSGQSPIYEPGLSEMMQSAMSSGNLKLTSVWVSSMGKYYSLLSVHRLYPTVRAILSM